MDSFDDDNVSADVGRLVEIVWQDAVGDVERILAVPIASIKLEQVRVKIFI